MILFNCEHATERMTDHLEGALSWNKRLAMWGHLIMCRACRAFLRSMRGVSSLARRVFDEPQLEPTIGSAMLDTALSRIKAGEGRGPLLHPDAQLWTLLEEGRADLPMKLLLETHLGVCATCRADHPRQAAHTPAPETAETVGGEPPLPAGILAQLPDPKSWTWYRHLLKGARSARLWEDEATGVGLWLTFVPKGRSFPHHQHTGQEAAVLLAGWIEDGASLAGPGDYIQHEGGTHHAPAATGPDGCWIFARVGPGGLHFRGWRAIFG